MTIIATPAEHPVMDIMAAMAEYAFARCFKRSIRALFMAIETTELFVGTIDLEIGVFIVVKQPCVP